MRLKTAAIGFCVLSSFLLPVSSQAASIKAIQVFNNLYNQGGTGGALGQTPSNITVNYFNGATQCDTAIAGFRTFVSEIIGTGAGQKCSDVTSIKIVAGTSSISTALQVYNNTPVIINITSSDYQHSIIIQDLGTGTTGTPASDGSIAPIFDTTVGTVASTGTLGYMIQESKLR